MSQGLGITRGLVVQVMCRHSRTSGAIQTARYVSHPVRDPYQLHSENQTRTKVFVYDLQWFTNLILEIIYHLFIALFSYENKHYDGVYLT